MSIADVIQARRTIRRFNEKPVSIELINELLDIAVWAPNHGMREPWRFICAASDQAKEQLADGVVRAISELKRYKWLPGKLKEMYKQKMQQIPAILFVVVKQDKNRLKREEDFAAACALIQNLQLCAWEREVGMIWSMEDTVCGNPTLCKDIGVGSDECVVGMLYIGYFDHIPKSKSRTPAKKKMTVL
ncbi:nitroreductase [Paenibacillus sp. HWE-109]|uniref:nitroreductase family protein n=1 Tax=Paenibacillus sp. HWE-109 TaxID=1306526 RepID=UPI001EDDB8E6|nr:nitroreductase [Paenibacillus sp. HWE-109]UKS26780.1 nitroreductase [Paenibacillus sp. HWE-109]